MDNRLIEIRASPPNAPLLREQPVATLQPQPPLLRVLRLL